MIIRQANKSDIDVLISILRSSHRDVAKRLKLTKENCPKFLGFCAEQRVKSDFDKGVKYYILEQDNQPLGCIALEKASQDVCYLERLSVLPEHRKKGYGKMLVNHLFEQAGKIGIRRVEIGMISKDRKLKSWYEKLGFVQTGAKKFDHLTFEVAFLSADIAQPKQEIECSIKKLSNMTESG
jgi:N-acetylglutamate synthase-like GNAT family acetyltransferase